MKTVSARKFPAVFFDKNSSKRFSHHLTASGLPANQSPLLRGVMPNLCPPDVQRHREEGHSHENPSQAAEALSRESGQIKKTTV